MIDNPALFYYASSLINLLLPLEGFIKMKITKKDYILRGGFIFFNALNLASWLIYGFISQTVVFANPIFLGISIIYVLVSLIFFQEYANIVYHNVIIINYSWWVRQQKADLIFKMSVFTGGLFLIVPHLGTLYYLTRNRDRKYFSLTQFVGHAISGIFYLVFCLMQGYIVLTLFVIAKFVILGVQVFVFRKLEEKAKILEEKAKIEENLKKKE